MSYIDVLIPLIGGIYFLNSGAKVTAANHPTAEAQNKRRKQAGMALIAASVLYFIAKLLSA